MKHIGIFVVTLLMIVSLLGCDDWKTYFAHNTQKFVDAGATCVTSDSWGAGAMYDFLKNPPPGWQGHQIIVEAKCGDTLYYVVCDPTIKPSAEIDPCSKVFETPMPTSVPTSPPAVKVSVGQPIT